MVLLPLLPFLAVLFAFGALIVAITAKSNSDAFANWMSGLTPLARLVLIGPVKLSLALARWVTHSIGANWKQAEKFGVAFLAGLQQWAAVPLMFLFEWPLELVKTAYWLLDVEIPKLLKQVPHLAAKVIRSVQTRVIHVERTIVKLPKLTKAQAHALVSAAVATFIHPFLADLQWLRRHFHALTAVLPRALPIPTVPSIPNILKRLRKLEKYAVLGVGIAAVARALARLGSGWIRCNNVQRLGKRACGLDPDLIESLLLDSLAIFGIVSIVEFAEGLQAIEQEAIGIMGKLVREWPA